MNKEEIIQLIRETVDQINSERSISAQHTSHHTHNGVDSPLLYNAPQLNVAQPSGGGTVDTQARTAINSILAILQNLNLMK